MSKHICQNEDFAGESTKEEDNRPKDTYGFENEPTYTQCVTEMLENEEHIDTEDPEQAGSDMDKETSQESLVVISNEQIIAEQPVVNKHRVNSGNTMEADGLHSYDCNNSLLGNPGNAEPAYSGVGENEAICCLGRLPRCPNMFTEKCRCLRCQCSRRECHCCEYLEYVFCDREFRADAKECCCDCIIESCLTLFWKDYGE